MDAPLQIVDVDPESSAVVAPKPWGFWATIGLSLAVIASFVAMQTVIIIGYMVGYQLMYPQTDPVQLAQVMDGNGLCLSLVSWISMPACLGMVLLFVKLRRGWTIRDYLALKPVPMRTMLGWLGFMVVFMAASDGLTYVLGRAVVPDFMSKVYQTAYSIPLLYATLMVASPVFEETFFRGFMVPGILHSRLGTIGALVIPAALWSMMHVQYNIYTIVQIFVAGLLLGAARLKTQSIYPTLAMHSLMNLVATLEVALFQ
jgi:CAAX protease family protein